MKPDTHTLQIARRWKHWLPWISIGLARVIIDPGVSDQTLAEIEAFHARICHRYLDAGIPWPTITRSSLDDPRTPAATRDQQFAVALERRRCRMGRVAGQRRPHYKETIAC